MLCFLVYIWSFAILMCLPFLIFLAFDPPTYIAKYLLRIVMHIKFSESYFLKLQEFSNAWNWRTMHYFFSCSFSFCGFISSIEVIGTTFSCRNIVHYAVFIKIRALNLGQSRILNLGTFVASERVFLNVFLKPLRSWVNGKIPRKII